MHHTWHTETNTHTHTHTLRGEHTHTHTRRQANVAANRGVSGFSSGRYKQKRPQSQIYEARTHTHTRARTHTHTPADFLPLLRKFYNQCVDLLLRLHVGSRGFAHINLFNAGSSFVNDALGDQPVVHQNVALCVSVRVRVSACACVCVCMCACACGGLGLFGIHPRTMCHTIISAAVAFGDQWEATASRVRLSGPQFPLIDLSGDRSCPHRSVQGRSWDPVSLSLLLQLYPIGHPSSSAHARTLHSWRHSVTTWRMK